MTHVRPQLLDDRRLDELTAECREYLAALGVREDDAVIFDHEYALRLCAEAICQPDTGEPLASLVDWRRMPHAFVVSCLQDYVDLEAEARPSQERVDALLAEQDARVRDRRARPTRELEDYRVARGCMLYRFYGRPACDLTLPEIAYHALYLSALLREQR